MQQINDYLARVTPTNLKEITIATWLDNIDM